MGKTATCGIKFLKRSYQTHGTIHRNKAPQNHKTLSKYLVQLFLKKKGINAIILKTIQATGLLKITTESTEMESSYSRNFCFQCKLVLTKPKHIPP